MRGTIAVGERAKTGHDGGGAQVNLVQGHEEGHQAGIKAGPCMRDLRHSLLINVLPSSLAASRRRWQKLKSHLDVWPGLRFSGRGSCRYDVNI